MIDFEPSRIAGASIDTILAEARRLADWASDATAADREEVREDFVAVDGVLLTRVVDLVRRGGIDELQAAHRALTHFLAGPESSSTRLLDPDLTAGWNGVADVIFEAARRRDRRALEPILASAKGKGRAVVEFVGGASGGRVARKTLRARLGLDEGALTRLLILLEEADLVYREQEPGSKEVWLTLGPQGHAIGSTGAMNLALKHQRPTPPISAAMMPELVAA